MEDSHKTFLGFIKIFHNEKAVYDMKKKRYIDLRLLKGNDICIAVAFQQLFLSNNSGVSLQNMEMNFSETKIVF